MRGSRMNPGDRGTRGTMKIIIVMGLCCFCYVLGAWQKSGTGRGDSIALRVTKETDCTILPNLHFETHHSISSGANPLIMTNKVIEPCHIRYSHYTPCHDQNRAMKFPRENMTYRERHCPAENEKLHCLIPAPKGYVSPFPWPKSRDYVPYANAPYKSLTIEKAVQHWIQFQGDVFKFPGGGTMFPNGASAYIDELAAIIPLADGTIRTALDTGCGVASFGAYLMDRNILTMSFAPRDSHEAQVQFALERGVPAVIGVLGTIKLPYPSRSFDLVHCSRCLIPWGSNGGMYLMEVDRVLRPGGYWVLSGPPINWGKYYQQWKRSKQDAQEDQSRIENIAEMLCWNKIYEKEDTAIWQKKANTHSCHEKSARDSIVCKAQDPDDVWYKKMEFCITPSGDAAQLKKFPDRLFAIPPRILEGQAGDVTEEVFKEDKELWKKYVNTYKRVNKLIGSSRYRNIMDMNAGLGSFAAALDSPKSWVMNVVPTISERNTLGIIYERGLIGIYAARWTYTSAATCTSTTAAPARVTSCTLLYSTRRSYPTAMSAKWSPDQGGDPRSSCRASRLTRSGPLLSRSGSFLTRSGSLPTGFGPRAAPFCSGQGGDRRRSSPRSKPAVRALKSLKVEAGAAARRLQQSVSAGRGGAAWEEMPQTVVNMVETKLLHCCFEQDDDRDGEMPTTLRSSTWGCHCASAAAQSGPRGAPCLGPIQRPPAQGHW